MAKSIKESLIKALASGKFISGQELAETLGVSRAAISNHVGSLEDIGLDVFKVRGKGYQLAQPIELLDRVKVIEHINKYQNNNVIEVHNIIDSTNNYLMRKLPNQVTQGQVCLAECQLAGRGRRGKQWVSPFGSHLYLSLYHKLDQGMSQAMGLSIACALAVTDTVSTLYNVDVELKWPNDIYINGKKLAGILIDLEGQATGECHSVIGVGINVSMPAHIKDKIDQPWIDLHKAINQPIDRNLLAATLIHQLEQRVSEHKRSGLQNMLNLWHKHDLFLNKAVKLITGENETLGVCRGINEQGALLLDVEGEIKPIYGGEVSMRGVT